MWSVPPTEPYRREAFSTVASPSISPQETAAPFAVSEPARPDRAHFAARHKQNGASAAEFHDKCFHASPSLLRMYPEMQ